YVHYLNLQATKTTDEDLKVLINTIQLALFTNDLSQLGANLKGLYRQTWEAIVSRVETEGIDPRIFRAIILNTLTILGPAPHRRSIWRNDLMEVRNQATASGNPNMISLLDAVIGLLDAGGNPAGLGEGLKGIYAKTWQAILEKLGN